MRALVQTEVFMGRISKAIEKKKKELMWLKIKLGIKVGAIILLPIIIGIVIHIIKKKAKKHVKCKIKETIRMMKNLSFTTILSTDYKDDSAIVELAFYGQPTFIYDK